MSPAIFSQGVAIDQSKYQTGGSQRCHISEERGSFWWNDTDSWTQELSRRYRAEGWEGVGLSAEDAVLEGEKVEEGVNYALRSDFPFEETVAIP